MDPVAGGSNGAPVRGRPSCAKSIQGCDWGVEMWQLKEVKGIKEFEGIKEFKEFKETRCAFAESAGQ